MRTLEVPLADSAASPRQISSDYYYQMPVRPIYRTYPIYYPGREPAGYLDSLRRQEPETLFAENRLKTLDDWIRAGELVFDAPIEFENSGTRFDEVRHRAWYDKNRVPITRNGIFPNMRYVVRERGKVEVGILACAGCHTRVMLDGSTINGAQGNFPDDRAFGYESRLTVVGAADAEKATAELRAMLKRFYAARVPDLIGVKDRLKLDSTWTLSRRGAERSSNASAAGAATCRRSTRTTR